MNADLTIITELSLLGIDASYDNGKASIDGQPVTMVAAKARLDTEKAKPRPKYANAEAARAAMAGWIDRFLTKITGHVPAVERASWPTKAEAARAVKAGNARPDQVAMITAEATISKRTNAELVDVIIARADVYEAIVGEAAGLRVALGNKLEAKFDPLRYEAKLEDGKGQARELAESPSFAPVS